MGLGGGEIRDGQGTRVSGRVRILGVQMASRFLEYSHCSSCGA